MLLFGGFSKLKNEGSIPTPNAIAIFGPLLSVALKIITVGWAPHGVAQWFRRSQGDVWFRVRSGFGLVRVNWGIELSSRPVELTAVGS